MKNIKNSKITSRWKGLKKVAEFKSSLKDGNEDKAWPQALVQLKSDVRTFARSFPVVGFDEKTMTYA